MAFKESELATEFLNFIDCAYKDEINGGSLADKPVIIFTNQEKDTNDIEVPIIRFSCLETYKKPTTLGDKKRFVRKGIITILVSVPTGTLTYDIQEITDMIVEHYECKTICDVNTRDISISEIVQSDSVWYSRSIIISFNYYITK